MFSFQDLEQLPWIWNPRTANPSVQQRHESLYALYHGRILKICVPNLFPTLFPINILFTLPPPFIQKYQMFSQQKKIHQEHKKAPR